MTSSHHDLSRRTSTLTKRFSTRRSFVLETPKNSILEPDKSQWVLSRSFDPFLNEKLPEFKPDVKSASDPIQQSPANYDRQPIEKYV
jgi:hypothetical protein